MRTLQALEHKLSLPRAFRHGSPLSTEDTNRLGSLARPILRAVCTQDIILGTHADEDTITGVYAHPVNKRRFPGLSRFHYFSFPRKRESSSLHLMFVSEILEDPDFGVVPAD